MAIVETKVFDLAAGADREIAVREAAEARVSGGIVLIPTETVYGLLVRADNPDVVSRLYELKERDLNLPMAFLAPDRAGAAKILKGIPRRARSLVDRFWPGPLTLIVDEENEGGNDPGTLGVRVTAQPTAQEVLRQAGVPVFATSANRSGEPPLVRGEEAQVSFEGAVDIIILEGETPLKEASTVAYISDNSWELLREGIITKEMVALHMTQSVMLVCTGNSCRSPMAEGLLKQKVAERMGIPVHELENSGIRIHSAGVAAGRGYPATEHAVTVMGRRGIDISDHQSATVSKQDVEAASRIYVMGGGHREGIVRDFPEVREKIRLVREKGIPDPIGGGVDTYEETAQAISDGLDSLLDEELEDILGIS